MCLIICIPAVLLVHSPIFIMRKHEILRRVIQQRNIKGEREKTE